jgi:hypothetical protein
MSGTSKAKRKIASSLTKDFHSKLGFAGDLGTWGHGGPLSGPASDAVRAFRAGVIPGCPGSSWELVIPLPHG